MPPARISAGPTAPRSRTAPLTRVAAAVAVVLGTLSGEAGALSLGRVNVLSALGEPLRAEVDIAEITAAEVEGLRVNIASSDAFRVAGIPYNTALSDVRASLQRRADGRYIVRLTSTRSLTDPFVDLLLEANTSTSRVVRDYTLLLDPPASRPVPVPVAAASTPAQVGQGNAVRETPRDTPRALPAMPAVRSTQRPVETPPVPASSPLPAPAPARETARGMPPASAPQQVTVRAGDTASRIANSHKPAEVSLDQMLVAMLRTNPDAFIGGNMNRIRAGALIDLPDATQAGATAAPEARRMVVAQSRDFGDYRRRLADNAPASRVAESGRQASGRLQASVENRDAPVVSPDKLTIAQGRLADQQLAQARQAQESSARMAELSKNIGELNRLQAAGNGTVASGAAAGPAATASSGASAAPTAPNAPIAPIAVGAVTAALPVAVPPSPTASSTASPVASPAPAAPEEPAWYVDLFNNPIVLGALSLIVLLLGWMTYRLAGKRRQDAGDSVFLESRLPKDSFFAGSGGESVDTKNRGNSIISSLSYSPSQMDSGDVDPVAEADVYLAYGRDLQAEEILREALRVNPERAAIHLKLLEIHAKRRDLRAYEALAADVQKLTGGTGNDWSRVTEMGKELDPGNPLYEAGRRSPTFAHEPVAPVAAAAVATAAAGINSPGFSHTLGAPSPPPAAGTFAAPPPAFVPSVTPLDFDLDLDRPDAQAALDSEWVSASLPTRPVPPPKAAYAPAPAPVPVPVPVPKAMPADAPINLPLIDLENDFNTEPGALEMPAARTAAPDAEHNEPVTVRGDLKDDSGFIEFDMSAFTGLRTAEHTDTEVIGLDGLGDHGSGSESPHAIKLSLARELQALGDTEGARSLVEEVEAESSGDLKVQAKHLLASLE